MIARKDNKEYKINDLMKAAYLNDGYDIYGDNGEIVEYSPKKTITINEHLKEVAELKAELEKANDVPKNAKELKAANEELTSQLDAANKKIAELEAELEKVNPATNEGDGNGKVQE